MDQRAFLLVIAAALSAAEVVAQRPPPYDDNDPLVPDCNLDLPQKPTYRHCLPGNCRCSETIFDCSGNFQNLTFIPLLPRTCSGQVVNLSRDGFTNITGNFFQNITQVEVLDFSQNGIIHIDRTTWGSLTNLKILIMIKNWLLTVTSVVNIFAAKKLECVDLRSGIFRDVSRLKHELQTNPVPNLTSLILHNNTLGRVNLSMFQSMANFSMLCFGLNSAHAVEYVEMPTLVELDLSRNRLDTFPETCRGNVSLFPRLKYLWVRKNSLSSLPARTCLPSLEWLDIGGNYFPEFYTDMFPFTLFPKLRRLYLDYINTKVKLIQGFSFRHPTLQTLSLIFNHIDFSLPSSFSVDSFAGCPDLQYLRLSANNFESVSDRTFTRLIGNITSLKGLLLAQTGFREISQRTFAALTQLEYLDLSNNKLTQIPDGAFDNNKNLTQLYLYTNGISRIIEFTFGESLRRQFRVKDDQSAALDVSDNPFICDCDLRWFSAWLRSNSTALRNARLPYRCSNINQTLPSFSLQDQVCLLSEAHSIDLIVSMCFLVLLLLGMSLLYRYKWQIRLRLYEVFRGQAEVRRQLLSTRRYRYDVFVSYSSADSRWVFQHLIPELEGLLRLRLCIHDRDFVPGRPVVDNIIQCLDSSRKIVMVFSKGFLASSWCQFELAVCLHHVLESEDTLIAVCLGDVASRRMTSAMTAVTSAMTYIQWEQGTEDCRRRRSEFSEKLRSALEDVLQ